MEIDLKNIKSNNKLIEYFIDKYSRTHKPIPVNFKEIVPNLNTIIEYPHLIHSYPAKLIPHIPNFFLNNNFFSKKGDLILDPFCGSGTVLLEALIAKRNSIGVDANPLARLITKVKSTYIDENILINHLEIIIKNYQSISTSTIPDINNRNYWFSTENQEKLGKLKKAILNSTSNDVKNFFLICFSNCVKKASYADPRIVVPVRLNASRFPKNSKNYNRVLTRINNIENIDIISIFKQTCLNNIKRVKNLKEVSKLYYAKVISDDARKITKNLNENDLLDNNSVDLIITSPPYAGAQKYIRSSSLNIGWLEMAKPNELKILDRNNIGRENYIKSELREIETGIKCADKLLKKIYSKNILRANIVGNYLNEMIEALNESIRVLKDNSYLIIIIGNNKVANIEFNTQEYITEYLVSKNIKLIFKLIDDIKSYGLMTKRNKTADVISREWILVFKK